MLSPEQFSELVAIIQTIQNDEPKPEVRRAQRISHPCRIAITLGTCENSGPTFPVQLKDISAHGMCFLYREELQRGTPFVVKLESTCGKSVAILGSVIHCLALDPNSYQIGAEFTCVLGQEPASPIEQSAEDLMRIRSSILT